jgi:colicin import membrane protein
MRYVLSSSLLALFTNLLLLILFFFGLNLTASLKKEEVKITLLEPQPTSQIAPPTLSTQESPQIPVPAPVREKVPLRRENLKSAPSKPESQGLTAREEEVLKKSLARLSKAQETSSAIAERTSDEFLKERLASLRKGAGGKGESGTPKETPTSHGAPVSSSLSQDYLLLIKRKLQTHFEVPIYLRNRKGLIALVEIETDEGGRIVQTKFLKKAEDPQFNQAVEKTLKAVNPMPVNQKIVLKIEFRAEGSFTIKP